MNYETLINGYKHILNTIYSPKHYYERIKIFLKEYTPPPSKRVVFQFKLYYITAIIKTVWVLGIKDKERLYFWQLLFSSLLKYPRAFPLSVGLAVYGFHFRKVVEKLNSTLHRTTTGLQPTEKPSK